MESSIARLDSSRLDDFLSFFDRDAFADNPEWASCYCLFYQPVRIGKQGRLRKTGKLRRS